VSSYQCWKGFGVTSPNSKFRLLGRYPAARARSVTLLSTSVPIFHQATISNSCQCRAVVCAHLRGLRRQVADGRTAERKFKENNSSGFHEPVGARVDHLGDHGKISKDLSTASLAPAKTIPVVALFRFLFGAVGGIVGLRGDGGAAGTTRHTAAAQTAARVRPSIEEPNEGVGI
jgi:hypothetical protein